MQNSPTIAAPPAALFPQLNDFALACWLTLLCAATRWLAVPASLWEWDDMLFARQQFSVKREVVAEAWFKKKSFRA